MVRRAAAVIACLALLVACAPVLRPAGFSDAPPTQGATRGEAAVGSVVGYVAGGLPPVILAVVGASCGWTGPVLVAFAVGGAAYSLLDPPETARAERVPPLLRATAGAVRGTVFFPAMMGFAGKKVYGPFVARALHRWRSS